MPDNPEWAFTLKSWTANYYEVYNPNGDRAVIIRIKQEIPEGQLRQELVCDLHTLNEVVKRGKENEKTLDFKPGIDLRNPGKVEQVENCTVNYHAREKSDGKRHIIIHIEEKLLDQRMVFDLGRLEKVVEEGMNFARVLHENPRKFPVVRLDSLSKDGETAFVQVVDSGDTFRSAELIAQKAKARRLGSEHTAEHGPGEPFSERDPIAWPVPQRYIKKGEQILELKRGVSDALDARIKSMSFNQERESPTHVVARWNDPQSLPDSRTPATWGGNRASTDGEPLDYRAAPLGRELGDKLLDAENYVLIRKKDNMVVGMSPDRKVMVEKLRELKAIGLAKTPEPVVDLSREDISGQGIIRRRR